MPQRRHRYLIDLPSVGGFRGLFFGNSDPGIGIRLFTKITVPDSLPDEPRPAQRKPAVAYARVGRFGIVSCGAAPNVSFGSTVVRRGDWHGVK